MVDLNTCKAGDKLLSRHGAILTYIGKCGENDYYDHRVLYSDGSAGTRMNDGYTYKNPEKRLPQDHDIIAILGEFEPPKEYAKHLVKLSFETAKMIVYWENLEVNGDKNLEK